MMYTPEQIIIMNRTARYKGAVGLKALVPGVIDTMIYNTPSWLRLNILDYGAGREAIHCNKLKDTWKNKIAIEAWDIGDNYMGSEFHTEQFLYNHYDIVYASNVFNIQPSVDGIQQVFLECMRALRPDGKFVFNYPTNRHSSITKNQLHGIGFHYFYKVDKMSHHGQKSSIFVARKADSPSQEKDLTNRWESIQSRYDLNKLNRG